MKTTYLTILRTPGVAFYSLQKGAHSVELAKVNDNSIHGWSDRLNDFADTAVTIARLDLIISVILRYSLPGRRDGRAYMGVTHVCSRLALANAASRQSLVSNGTIVPLATSS